MWFLIQGLIVFAVGTSNLYWHWTPNPYVAGGLGVAAAMLVTLIWNDLLLLLARKKRGK
ncbi:MAG TPA: hypothetical protein VN815_13195 [Steroidobacteraceae bacterium]|nr:hypothetical protein [Steroidobacteraceae bacterium]